MEEISAGLCAARKDPRNREKWEVTGEGKETGKGCGHIIRESIEMGKLTKLSLKCYFAQ